MPVKTKRTARAASAPAIDPTFTSISALLEKVQRSTFHRRVTDTSYEIRHDISDDLDGDWEYMAPFAELLSKRGTKLTLYPLLSYTKLRKLVTPALKAHALTNRKSFVFKDGIPPGTLRELAAIIRLASQIWYIEAVG